MTNLLKSTIGLAILTTLSTTAWSAGNLAGTGTAPTTTTKNYDYYLTGSNANQAPTKPSTNMFVLMGGGEDVDTAFQDMYKQAGCDVQGTGGTALDVVVIRTSGADGYNQYLSDLGKRGDGTTCVDSVESIVVKTLAGASDAFVVDKVKNADVLFIAGGDQSTYIKLWKGTGLDSALNGLIASKVPFGGTSAGLAVLGEVDYTGENGSITSTEALKNPYNGKLTLNTTFLNNLPGLLNTVTDSHLDTRDRMGRMITFMARMGQDKIGVSDWTSIRGIGITEATALVVTNGVGTVRFKDLPGAPSKQSVYFAKWSDQLPSSGAVTVLPKKPLNFNSGYLFVNTLTGSGGTFDLNAWTGGSGPQLPGVSAGVLTGWSY